MPFFPDRPERASDRRWWLAAWLPAFLAVGVICVESTQTFGAENTSAWLRPIFERIFGHLQDARWETLHHYLRKTGHFIGYGVVGLTFLRAWLIALGRRVQPSLHTWRMRATALAIVCAALVASGDEFHQSFLPGRTGVPSDVVLDTCGACVLCLLVWLVRFRRAPHGSEPLPADY
ncbi:MAG TPA: VanZ family protein [Acidobacteriaceae bacterium]|nr:VanZ family protein [Acidobacteriaceae bacterium]